MSKAAISQIRLLHHKKHRDEQSVFLVEGVKSCLEVLQSDLEVLQCYVTERFDIALWDKCRNLRPKCSCHSAQSEEFHANGSIISEKEMERISCLTTPSEILCVVKTPNYQLNNLDDTKPLLVLDALRDPGNMGTIIRTADWFGFNQILCSEDSVDLTNPKTIQATMGSFTRVKIVYANLEEYLKTQKNRTVYGLYMEGEPIHQQSFAANDMVIIGSESHGISEKLTSLIHKKIAIPMFPHKGVAPESLNAAIAAGIFMHTFRIKN